ncbi:MAG TPA: lytic transglycosylase domain-containing protein [Stellaceae bacterium]|nr:lytic transglycosylase domain-containing protein [Stellaceae bacterium]
MAARASERLPAKTLQWLELTRSGTAGFADIVGFADGNPHWPLQGVLRERAEAASADIPDGVLLPYFQKNPPTTPKGKLRLADMLVASGQGDAATSVIRALWLAPDLDPDTERAVLDRYGARLRPEDHAARLDRVIAAGLSSAAGRLLPLVPQDQRLLGEARLALASLHPNAPDLVSRVPPRLRRDAGLLIDEARWNRRLDHLDAAAQILLDAPKALHRPVAWWTESQILARRLIEAGDDRLAYEVLTRHTPSDDGAAAHAEADFLAGWLALRRLNEPKTAYARFTRLYQAAKLPASRSRSAYWAARAAEGAGEGDNARHWLTAAADYETTYYGQLAAARLRRAVLPKFPPEPFLSPDEIGRFDDNELFRAARMLSEIGQDDLAKPFLQRLNAAATTPGAARQVATLAEMTHHLDIAISAAKRAGFNGVPLLETGFPVIPIQRDGTAEKPLVLAIVRQESAFDVSAVSSSDARGLMQLKPATAKQVAKTLSLPFSADRLVADANFNLTLGSAYLDKMLDKFAGSYVLSIAAYNAGPNRVAQWLSDHGDPRDGSIDVVDWIELIPFGETRNYVQRVLENLQVYRLRVGDREQAFKLARDLKR